jgi:hypothetical protein
MTRSGWNDRIRRITWETNDRQCGSKSVPPRCRIRAYPLCLATRVPWAECGRHAAIQTISLHTGYGGRLDPFAEYRRPPRCLSSSSGERTETYLNWREAVLRYFLWTCDYLRATLTLALVSFVLFVHLREAGDRWAILPLALVIGSGISLSAVVAFGAQKRRLGRLWNELQPLEAFSSPPQEIDRNEFFLGGLCYCNPQNPALFVPGPLVFAVNLANKRIYLYSAYIAGFVLLAMWCIGMAHS